MILNLIWKELKKITQFHDQINHIDLFLKEEINHL